MAKIAFTRTEVQPFVPEAYRGLSGELQPTFQLAPLTGAQRHEVNAMRADAFATVPAGGQKHGEVRMGAWVRAEIQAARYALKGWANVDDQDGKPAPWPGSVSKAIDMLPTDVLQEIGHEAITRASITEEQRGN